MVVGLLGKEGRQVGRWGDGEVGGEGGGEQEGGELAHGVVKGKG